MKRITVIAITFLIFTGGTLKGQIPDFCLTKDEYRLYSLINEYRTKNGLRIIPVSTSLCYVAKIHARDLFINNPDTSFCSLNSWSDKGYWNACCHSKFTPNPKCIVDKPKELTQYQGEGHELAFWDSEQLHPDTVLHFWQSYEQTKELLLNQNKWSYFNWNAIGVGLYKGYACVWVGEVRDTIPEPKLCESASGGDFLVLPLKEMPKEALTSRTGRYCLIFGSFNTMADAAKMVEKYKSEGFYQAKILVMDEMTYRVSLSDHATQQEAFDAKKMLGEAYKEAWITKY